MLGSTSTSASARRVWPSQRTWTLPDAEHAGGLQQRPSVARPAPGRPRRAVGGTHPARRSRSTPRIATVMTSPMIGSAAGQPRATPAAPTTTASEVSPSVRACSPSATSAADPIRLPTRIRYSATTSFPANPMTPATATQPRCSTGARMDQPVDRLPAGDDRGQRDHRDDEETGQVLDAAEPVGVPAGRRPAGEHEGDPQRHRGHRVRDVVHGVGQQRHGPADRHHQHLQQRGDHQDHQADLHRTNALAAALQCRVDRIRAVMAVRGEHRSDRPAPAGRWWWSMVVVWWSWSCGGRGRGGGRGVGGVMVVRMRLLVDVGHLDPLIEVTPSGCT